MAEPKLTRDPFGDGMSLALAAVKVAGQIFVDDRAERGAGLARALERAIAMTTAVQRIKPIPRWQLMNEPPRSAQRNRRRRGC